VEYAALDAHCAVLVFEAMLAWARGRDRLPPPPATLWEKYTMEMTPGRGVPKPEKQGGRGRGKGKWRGKGRRYR
jgi:hypothetical protein